VGRLHDLLAGLDEDRLRRGKQFERICKWFLTNDSLYQHQVRRVWLWDEWPGRWGADAGIDLVVEDREGSLWAVQAKAYDPAYSVTKADVGTFLSESSRPQFSYRLLIATTNRVGSTARRTLAAQEKQAGLLLLADLEAAQVDWPSSPAALRPKAPKRKRPRPHQAQAIRAVDKGFAADDRGQMIMACGTGKTLTALFIAERLKAERTLVLVPSLSLLAQTMREWTANASEDFDYLLVCSDDTVSDPDAAVSSTSDLSFPVTTDAEDIARFLRRRSGRRVVFSTYQSSPRIAEAYRLGGVPRLDLAVADEAHRCAGRVSSDFATILDAGAIPAHRRLFMSATPRYFTGRVVREAKEADFEVASMDDSDTFGPVFHSLSFGEAIERDLLSDYQVAVIGVHDATCREWAERGRFVTLDGTAVTDARRLAGQIGVAKAMRRYKLHRTISFHSRVARARDFASSLTEVVRWMPADQRPEGSLWAQHVSGEMSTGQRTISLERLRQLDDDAVGLLANARCLAEGVDVPTLDGVAFIDPRRSEVDIVQAVGRAIRKAENKTKGTIVIPVFIDAEEDPDAALDDSAFKPVWDVIRALRAHDEDLTEQLDSLRRELGRGASSVTLPPKIHLDLPARVGLDFASAFEVRLVERTTSSWEFWIGLLEAFAHQEGHSRVPTKYSTPSGFKLGSWCDHCRAMRKADRLSAERVAALDALGFVWDIYQDDFDLGLAELSAYVQAHRDARVAWDHTTSSGFKLGGWCVGRRAQRKACTLNATRIAALDALGFVWDPYQEDFDHGLVELAAYVQEHGDARVSQHHSTPSGFSLGSWCNARRGHRKAVTLSIERIAALDALGFVWDPSQDALDRSLAELAAYVQEHGEARVPWDHTTPSGFKLGTWCVSRRADRNAGTLSAKLVAALDALGFIWDPRQEDFDRGLVELAAYVDAHGHARVPQGHTTPSGFKLGTWCHARRADRNAGTLSAKRVAALDALGFVWDPLQGEFDRGLTALSAYVQVHGDARVPVGHSTPSGFKLGGWCRNRRTNRKAGTLSTQRIAALDALGFIWDPRQEDFDRGHAELAVYVQEQGDARVPVKHSTASGFKLGGWCRNRRTERKAGTLSTQRIAALDALGFVWDPVREGFDRKPRRVRSGAR
jgi:superfamily II DNA or RNA helicase